MKTEKIVTKEYLMKKLEDEKLRPIVIGRALVALFAYQTNEEKKENTTSTLNGVGFTGADGYSGTLTAKYFLKHKTLQDWQVERWMKPAKSGLPRICKYADQLNKIANLKQQTNTLTF